MERNVEEAGTESEHASTQGTSACDGCKRHAFRLRVVDEAKLCDICAVKSALIDQKLEHVHSDDPVECDACGTRIEFDARIAVVMRECGGAVFCNLCKPTSAREAS